jgi:hypothetical protein
MDVDVNLRSMREGRWLSVAGRRALVIVSLATRIAVRRQKSVFEKKRSEGRCCLILAAMDSDLLSSGRHHRT